VSKSPNFEIWKKNLKEKHFSLFYSNPLYPIANFLLFHPNLFNFLLSHIQTLQLFSVFWFFSLFLRRRKHHGSLTSSLSLSLFLTLTHSNSSASSLFFIFSLSFSGAENTMAFTYSSSSNLLVFFFSILHLNVFQISVIFFVLCLFFNFVQMNQLSRIFVTTKFPFFNQISFFFQGSQANNWSYSYIFFPDFVYFFSFLNQTFHLILIFSLM